MSPWRKAGDYLDRRTMQWRCLLSQNGEIVEVGRYAASLPKRVRAEVSRHIWSGALSRRARSAKETGVKLYEVRNGYLGYGPVHCLVLAEDREEAIELAAKRFKAESDRRHDPYEEDYWTDLEAHLLSGSTVEPWVSEIRG